MAKKEDEREVGWAPRQIKALKRKAVDLSASIANIWHAHGELEKTVEKLDQATMAHIGSLNTRLSKIAEGRAGGVDRKVEENVEDIRVLRSDHMALQNRQVGFNEATMERQEAHAQQLAGMAEKISWLQDTAAEAQREIERRLGGLEAAIADADARMLGYPRRHKNDQSPVEPVIVENVELPHDFSYPVGVGKSPQMDRITGMAAVRDEMYQRGLSAGREMGRAETISNAEARVKQYMESAGWTQSSIDSVVDSLHGITVHQSRAE